MGGGELHGDLREHDGEALRRALAGRQGAALSGPDAEVVRAVLGDGAVRTSPDGTHRLDLGIATSPSLHGIGVASFEGEAPADDGAPDAKVAAILDDFTDDQNARQFVEDHLSHLRYRDDKKVWLTWTGKVWAEISDAKALQFARETANHVNALVAEQGDAAQTRAAKSLRNVARQKAMLQLACGVEDLSTNGDDWDNDPLVLNTDDGLVHLALGDTEPHDPSQMTTKITAHGFDRDQTCPTWREFLETSLEGDAEYIAYMQRVAGLCLLGETLEEVFFFVYGPGANGKTVFTDTMQAMLGRQLSITIPAEFLTMRASNMSAYVEADLEAKRLAVAPELPQGARLNEAKLKQLSGRELVYARQPGQSSFQFFAVATLVMTGNYKPEIRGDDDGIWRRVRLLPFTATIPPEKRNRHLTQQLRDELPGILGWAAAGALRVKAQGLGSCRRVDEATGEFKAESDRVQAFLDETCERDPRATVTIGTLYRAYEAWTREGNEPTLSKRAFGQRMGELGFDSDKNPAGTDRIRRGLALTRPWARRMDQEVF